MVENNDNKFKASKELQEIYCELIREFETNPDYKGFEEYKSPEKVTELKEVAGNIYWWFSTHFYKAQDIICRYEDQNTSFTTSIFNQENITVLDIGSGPGTFCLALLDILYKIQKNPLPNIDIVMVEPNENYIDIAKKLINQFCEKISIKVDIYVVNDYFPENSCIEKINEILNKLNVDFLIISMCNILNWIKDRFKENKPDARIIIEQIIENIKPFHAVLLSVEPAKYSILGNIQKYLQRILSKISNRYNILESNKYEFYIYNFPKSYYFKIYGEKCYKSIYYGAFVAYNTTISKMAENKELLSAFFKARMNLKKEFPYDEVEIKLFEYKLKDNINKLSKEILKGYKFSNKFLGYEVPKSEIDVRYKVMDNIFDTTVCASFLDVVSINIDEKFMDNSCGNRLNKRLNTEYIYEYFWYAWYFKFIKKVIDTVSKRYDYFLQIDIKSFYTNIKQNILYDKIIKLIPNKDGRLKEFISTLINRHIPNAKSGCGLPQGSITSGFLANLYLHDFDKYFIKKTNNGYMRYVDDIFMFGKTEKQIDDLKHEAENKLKDLNLEINKDKTNIGTKSSLKSLIYDDKELDEFDRRLTKILHSLYNINKEYYFAYKNNRERFLNWYSDCLRSINLIISPDWLNRKIYCEQNRIKRFIHIYFNKDYIAVDFPEYQDNKSDIHIWKEEFINRNFTLVNEINELKEQMAVELQNLYNKYGNLTLSNYDEITKKKIRAKYRFYTYRAGILYNPDVVEVIENIMEYTWLYNITVLRSYPQLVKKMINTLKHTKSKYLKYAIIWALGEMKDRSAIISLQDILFDTNSSDVLKLMCSQSLIKINANCDEIDQDKLLKEIEIQYKNKKSRILKNLILLLCEDNVKKIEKDYDLEVFDAHSVQLLESAIEVEKDKINIMAILEQLPEGIDSSEYPDIEPGPEIVPFYQ